MATETVDDIVRGSCFDHALGILGDADGDLFLTLYESVALRRWGRLRLALEALRGRASCGNEVVLARRDVVRLAALLAAHLERTADAG